MHKKSIEAAEQFKQQDSDKEDGVSVSSTDSSPNLTNQLPSQHQQHQSGGVTKEDFRSSSIAALRAKAQEHSAKMLLHEASSRAMDVMTGMTGSQIISAVHHPVGQNEVGHHKHDFNLAKTSINSLIPTGAFHSTSGPSHKANDPCDHLSMF